MKRLTYLALLLLCTLLSGISGCAQKNAMGRKQVSILPDSVLNEQATTFFDQEKLDKKISSDKRLSSIVQRVANRLIKQANIHYGQYCEGFEWDVQLFEEPDTKNAYCAPGGKIGIYTGILPVCKNEAGLAVIMGHEISHALLRHSNGRATSTLGITALAAIIEAALGEDASEEKKGLILGGVAAASQFAFLLPNSRVDENEADHMGLLLMALAGYDPNEAPKIWARMKALSEGETPEFMSTHPSDGRREKRLTEFLIKAQPMYDNSKEKWGLGENL